MRWLNSITSSRDMNLSKLRRLWRTEESGVLQSLGLQRVRHDFTTQQQKQKVFQNSSSTLIFTFLLAKVRPNDVIRAKLMHIFNDFEVLDVRFKKKTE